jgi:hypothetical protein
MEKANAVFKNNTECQEETIFQRNGAKAMNLALSGQFVTEDVELAGIQTSSEEPAVLEKKKLSRILSLFANRLSFMDEKVNSIHILRNDLPFGPLNFISLRCQSKLQTHDLMS